MKMTLTVIYISKSENDLEMTDFIKYRRIAKMTYGVWASTKFNETVTLAKTVQQKQVFLQLLMVYTIVYT